jgi:hypothetical protein
VKPGPEHDLLESWYEAAVEQDPSLGPSQGAMKGGKVTTQAMLHRLLRSRTCSEGVTVVEVIDGTR